MALPNLLGENGVSAEIDFHCERCVQCEQCGSREAGKNRLNKWSRDFKLCSNCNKKRKKKQCCQICDSLWPDEIIIPLETAIPNTEGYQVATQRFIDYMQDNMIQCGQCKISVHFKCDYIFDDHETLRKFKALQ